MGGRGLGPGLGLTGVGLLSQQRLEEIMKRTRKSEAAETKVRMSPRVVLGVEVR